MHYPDYLPFPVFIPFACDFVALPRKGSEHIFPPLDTRLSPMVCFGP